MRDFMNIVEQSINEAPIADLEVFGQPNALNSFTDVDKRLLNSSKAKAKIYRVFKNTPFIFNFYVIMGTNISYSKEEDITKVENLLGRKIDKKGKITIIYTNNVTGRFNHIPMNSWILAHRIAHALQSSMCSTKITQIAENVIFQKLFNLYNIFAINKIFPMKSNQPSATTPWSKDYKIITDFSNMLFTMKSARDHNIINPLDVAGEAIAQYLIKGKVTLERYENWDWQRAYYNSAIRPHMLDFEISYTPEEINMMIENAEQAINTACEMQFKRLVGKVLSF